MANRDIQTREDDLIEEYWDTCDVYIGGARLDPDESLAVYSHSLTSFAWGYGGFGPSQLALALLFRVTNRETACMHYQAFKWDLIASLPQAVFPMPLSTVREWLASQTGI